MRWDGASCTITEIGESRVATFYTCLLAHLAGKAPERWHGFEVWTIPPLWICKDSLIILLCIWQQIKVQHSLTNVYFVHLGSMHTLYLASQTICMSIASIFIDALLPEAPPTGYIGTTYKAHNIHARPYLVACSQSATYSGEVPVIPLKGSGISSRVPCWWQFLVQSVTFIRWMMTWCESFWVRN